MPPSREADDPVRLLSLALAVPPFRLGQEEVATRAASLFGATGGTDAAVARVHAHAGVRTRYSCVPLDWYLSEHDAAERASLYRDAALRLLEEAAARALAKAGLAAADVDAIVSVSSTGIATPSLDAHLAGRMGFRPDIVRLPIFGLGCAGGVLGLSRAAALARAMPGRRVLLVVVETCGLTFRPADKSNANRVATALFGDGAAACLVSTEGAGVELGPSGEHLWPDTLDVMGWDVVADGLKVVFSQDIPRLVRHRARSAADAFLAARGLSVSDLSGLVCHPGGPKVMDAIAEAFALDPAALGAARQVLSDHGNMSAPTVLFVLDEMVRAGARGLHLMLALGPGFSVGFQLVRL